MTQRVRSKWDTNTCNDNTRPIPSHPQSHPPHPHPIAKENKTKKIYWQMYKSGLNIVVVTGGVARLSPLKHFYLSIGKQQTTRRSQSIWHWANSDWPMVSWLSVMNQTEDRLIIPLTRRGVRWWSNGGCFLHYCLTGCDTRNTWPTISKCSP